MQLADDLKHLIAQQVAEGRVASEADFIAEAVRLYAGYLGTEPEMAALIERADADVAAGRYVTVSTPRDNEALHQRMMDRLRANLARTSPES